MQPMVSLLHKKLVVVVIPWFYQVSLKKYNGIVAMFADARYE